jgi:hypothetical protein
MFFKNKIEPLHVLANDGHHLVLLIWHRVQRLRIMSNIHIAMNSFEVVCKNSEFENFVYVCFQIQYNVIMFIVICTLP